MLDAGEQEELREHLLRVAAQVAKGTKDGISPTEAYGLANVLWEMADRLGPDRSEDF